MALDGTIIANLVHEMKEKLVGGRILKIQQPEKDELLITIKNYDQYRLFISADASLPLIYLASTKKEAPMTAPNFCMLLRKYIGTARIVDIFQPEYERIIVFELEHLDEMGDVCRKKLIVEIMGKHSNIIFCEAVGPQEADISETAELSETADRQYRLDGLRIIDSIKHVSAAVSSVREVLPGRDYFITKTIDKLNPVTVTEKEFADRIGSYPGTVSKALYMSLTGISPVMANELVFRAGLEAEYNVSELKDDLLLHLYKVFQRFMDEVRTGSFSPCIIFKNGTGENRINPDEGDEETGRRQIPSSPEPVEFNAVRLTLYENSPKFKEIIYPSVSEVLEQYYSKKNLTTRIKQKSTDLRHVVANASERTSKKIELLRKQLQDTEKRDTYKLYGELLTTFGYGIESGVKAAVVNNYYTNEDITIPLEEQLTALENAKKYYDRYSKLKRTFEAGSVQYEQAKEEMEHLDSIKVALDIAACDDDLDVIKRELIEFGYIKGHFGRLKLNGCGQVGKKSGPGNGKASKGAKNGKGGAYAGGNREKSKPMHYVTEDGFHIYVGKNNYQNDELTFKFANGNDWWFHAKQNAGSHVIVKTEGRELPDHVFEQAAALAAYYSKAGNGQKVDVDYLERKNVKKPNGAKPGFVIYYTNYSMTVKPGTEGLTVI